MKTAYSMELFNAKITTSNGIKIKLSGVTHTAIEDTLTRVAEKALDRTPFASVECKVRRRR